MKIGIAGTHRTGKTTLAEKLAEEAGFVFAKTTTSAIFEARKILPIDKISWDDRFDIQWEILEAMNALWKKWHGRSFVTDRTPIDAYAYLYYHDEKRAQQEMFDSLDKEDFDTDREMHKYLNTCEFLMGQFDYIFILQQGIPFEIEVGKESPETANRISELILNPVHKMQVLSTTMVGVIPEEALTVDDRVSFITWVINSNRSENERWK